MKKIIICFFSILLFIPKVFSDCYFSFDGPSIVALQGWPSSNAGSAYSLSGIVGISYPFFIKDNFPELKTSYLLELFSEAQFTGRWNKKEYSKNNSINKKKITADNDFYVSAGINLFQIFRPKISYGFLTKDVYASIFIGVPLPLLGETFLTNSSNLGFQACFGFEPAWNLTNNKASSTPYYFNYRANFKIHLDFSRHNRYAKYEDNQRIIQIEKEESERRLLEQKLKQERLEEKRQKEIDEKKAKELGFSSVEDYKRQSYDNFYNQVLYGSGVPLELGDIFTIKSGYIEVVDRRVDSNGYTYLVTIVSSAYEKGTDNMRQYGVYGGGFRHCFYINTKSELNLKERTELTTRVQYITNKYNLKLMCAGKTKYQRNFQDIDGYIFVATEEMKN